MSEKEIKCLGDGVHDWSGADNMVFVSGVNKGSSADVFCQKCDMGAFTDSQGKIIQHSIARVDWKD